ncbi:glycosyltransferase family 2 protein [Candidatus Bathyarchaeota archaeon]|nr:MAG: glycosyltransferase family 2 protein [Candidatus Bathyarchaeota archaeon]
MFENKVSIIIATYNRFADLKDCLSSIFNLKDKVHEVIVVDSNSSDKTPMLKEYFPIKYISIIERNRQRARNIGLSVACGDIVAFLDDDVIVHNSWLRRLLEPYLNESVGGVGGRVIPYGQNRRFYVKISTGVVGKVSKSGLVIGNFDLPLRNPIEVDSFIGCNMSFRRDLLLKVGGFDENFGGTGYRDDTDLCLRVKSLGYKLIFHPGAIVWHKFKGKNAGNNWFYWYARNHVYFYLKNLFPRFRTRFPLFFYRMFFPPRDYVLKSGIKIRVNPLLASYIFKGLYDGYQMWRQLLRTNELR